MSRAKIAIDNVFLKDFFNFHCQLSIVNYFGLLVRTFPVATPYLLRCYPVATPNLPACYPESTPNLPRTFRLAIPLLPLCFPLLPPCCRLTSKNINNWQFVIDKWQLLILKRNDILNCLLSWIDIKIFQLPILKFQLSTVHCQLEFEAYLITPWRLSISLSLFIRKMHGYFLRL